MWKRNLFVALEASGKTRLRLGRMGWVWAIVGAVCVAATVGVASAVWGSIMAAYSAVAALLRGSVIVQSMFGTTIAGTAMAFTAAVGHHVRLWVMGAVSTTVIVNASQCWALHQALVKYLSKGCVVDMPTAVATLALEESLTASQKFAMLQRALRRRRRRQQAKTPSQGKRVSADGSSDDEGPTELVQLATKPTGVPLARTFQGKVLLITVQEFSITIQAPGRGRQDLLRAFLQQVLEEYRQRVGDHVAGNDRDLDCPGVFTAMARDDGTGTGTSRTSTGTSGTSCRLQWTRVRELRARSRDTLFLPGKVMDTLLADAEKFFSSASDYERRQVPFRRGWMLHGPPGTGKSTVPVVVASELGLPLYVLDVGCAGLTDDAMRELLTTAPVPSLVVLEDVDAASKVVGPRPSNSLATNLPPATALVEGATTRVTLAGLLNVLDGLVAHEGHLVIMTTNHLHLLDPALTRPGRCDVVQCVPLATREQITAMLLHEFPQATLDEQAQFLTVVRPGKFSPAAIAEYLLRMRGDLSDALNEDNLATLRMSGTDIDDLSSIFVRRVPGLFKFLWQQGLEATFPWALQDGVELSVPLVLDPHFILDNRPVLLLDTEEDVAQVFLVAFPKARREAVIFAARVMEWCRSNGLHMQPNRVRVHLQTHIHDVDGAVDRVGDWLLTYKRAGANLLPPLSVRFVLYFYGVAASVAPAVFDDLVAQIHALGVVDGGELVLWKDSDKTTTEVKGRGAMARELLAKVHAEPVGGGVTGSGLALRTFELASRLVNAYEDLGVTMQSAMQALRPPLSTLDGRTGFSARVLRKLVTKCASLEECLAVMAADQDAYEFPPLFRGPV